MFKEIVIKRVNYKDLHEVEFLLLIIKIIIEKSMTWSMSFCHIPCVIDSIHLFILHYSLSILLEL